MEVDWDLHAVVRGCAIVTTTNTTTRCGGDSGGATSSSTTNLYPQAQFPNYEFEARNDTEDLHQLYKSFFTKTKPSSSLSTISFSKDEQVEIKEHKQPTATSKTHTSRSKRRKNIMKRICQVPAESLSSDVWAWRKYGQKPIKGSPYPRGYYRCSTSKGCLARKQVDRNKSDPDMYIVTYTAEHNHPAPTYRNSLAGSTRQKPSTPQTVAAGDSTELADSLSPTTLVDEEVVVQSTKAESGEDLGEDDDFGMSDTAVSDDFFEGLEGLADIVTGDCFSGDFPASFDLPLGCVAYNVANAAGGI